MLSWFIANNANLRHGDHGEIAYVFFKYEVLMCEIRRHFRRTVQQVCEMIDQHFFDFI